MFDTKAYIECPEQPEQSLRKIKIKGKMYVELDLSVPKWDKDWQKHLNDLLIPFLKIGVIFLADRLLVPESKLVEFGELYVGKLGYELWRDD
jgi:hypothetical protein